MPRGPSSWLRRIPRAPAFSATRGIFEFQHPSDYPIALATDLQVRPPGSDHCRTCASATGGGLHPIGQDGRHWISCPHGIRLQRSVHHPVRDTLAWLLTAVLGERIVIRETPDGGGRMRAFMQRFPGLGHQPTASSWRASTGATATRSWRSRRVRLPVTPGTRASTRTPRGAGRTATSSGPWRLASIPSQPTSRVHLAYGS